MPIKVTFPFPVRLLFLALLGGGGVGALFNLWVFPNAWPWGMPPLAHRFLAGAAAAYFVGSLITLWKSRWMAAELLIITVLVYGFPLVGAIFVDLDLIDWTKPIAWAFVGIVTPAVLISVWYGWTWRTRVQFSQNLPLNFKTYLLVLGIAAGIVGLLVFIAPKQAGLLWPWAVLPAWKPLDSRLIASMLLTISSMAFYTRWRNDRDAWDVTAGMLLAYCLIAGIGLGLHAAATPEFLVPDAIYLVIFVVIGGISLKSINPKESSL